MGKWGREPLHILTDVHALIASADFMRELKVSTSIWMKSNNLFPLFKGWSDGYGSFTCSYRDLKGLIEYVKNQQVHHQKTTFEDEYRTLISESGLKVDERFFP